MTNQYICVLCASPCFLEVEDSAEKPYVCPFNETDEPEWELMKTEDNND